MMQYHIVNQEAQTKTVWFKYTFTFVRFQDKPPADLVAVRGVWLDVQNYCSAEFTIPGNNGSTEFADSIFIKSRTWKSPFSGVIAFVGGHLHKTGLKLILSHNSQPICELKATYLPEDNGYLSSMGFCNEQHPQVEIGDQLEVVAVYNHSQSPVKAMGIFLTYAHITDMEIAQNISNHNNIHDHGALTDDKTDSSNDNNNNNNKNNNNNNKNNNKQNEAWVFVILGLCLSLLTVLVTLVTIILVLIIKQGHRMHKTYTEMNSFN
jgi:hypothetical protein